MITLSRWQSTPALIVVLGIASSAIAPLTIPASVDAQPAPYRLAGQLFPSQPSSRLAIPAGTRIPVRYDKAEKIVVLPTETAPLTLTVARNIRSTSGVLLIPAGSLVKGNLKPAEGGSQFVADNLVLSDGTTFPFDATSQVVTKTQEIQPGADTSSILKGAAIGAAAAAVISGVTGRRRITLGKLLIGGGLGALGGLLLGKKRADVVVINPNTDLALTLNSTLALGSSRF